MIKTPLGKIVETDGGNFVLGTPYDKLVNVYDSVTNASYRSKIANTNVAITDTVTWQKIAQGVGSGTGQSDNNYSNNAKAKVDALPTNTIGTTLNTLISTIGENKREIYFPSGIYVIDTNISIPSNIKLIFANGAGIFLNTGITVTINGEIESNLQQIFFGSGTVILGNKITTVYPEWWGSKNDNTNNTFAVQAAINTGKTVKILFSTFDCVLDTITVATSGQVIESERQLHLNSPIQMNADRCFFKFVKIVAPNGGFVSNNYAQNIIGDEITGGGNMNANSIGIKLMSYDGKISINRIVYFDVGLKIGEGTISGSSYEININAFYATNTGIYLSQGFGNNIHFNSIDTANPTSGTGIYIHPLNNSASDNRFYFGRIANAYYGIRLTNSGYDHQGNLFIGIIFSCSIGMILENEGEHEYTTFIGGIDCLGITGSVDLIDYGKNNTFIFYYIRDDAITLLSDTSIVLNATKGTMKLPVLTALPVTGRTGEMCIYSSQMYFYNGTAWTAV